MELMEVGPVLGQCRQLNAQGAMSLAALRQVLLSAEIPPRAVAELSRGDPNRPYGRRVLHADAHFEAMIALWTRGTPCAPHDHGGSVGGVRVLQGEALHRVYRVGPAGLELVREERVAAGDVLSCGPDLVHAMEDAGAALPLATLHLYAGPIDHMVVYDEAGGRTLVVEGGSGAWLPWDQPELIRRVHDGFLAPSALA